MTSLKPLRVLAKHGLALMAQKSFALAALKMSRVHLTGPVVRIFGYHRITPDVSSASLSSMRSLCVSARAFRAELDHLMQNYQVLSLADAALVLAGRRPPSQRPVAVLTFDDGYEDVLHHAAPLLAARGLPATLFVTTGAAFSGTPLLHDRLYALLRRAARARVPLGGLGATSRAAWALALADHALCAGLPVAATDALLFAVPHAELQALAMSLGRLVGEPGPQEVPALLDPAGLARVCSLGMTLGAHTVSHPHLPLLDDDALEAELSQARLSLRSITGQAPDTLAYPAGRYDRRVLHFCRRAGYTVAVTTEDGSNVPGCDLLRLSRTILSDGHGRGVTSEPSEALIAAELDGLFPLLRLRRRVAGDARRETPWWP